MKSLVKLLVVLAILGGVLFYASKGDAKNLRGYVYYSICDQPQRFRIESIDPKFGLKEETLLKDIEKAADLWNKEYGKEIFVYDPQGDLEISFVYDKKQDLNKQINDLEGKLNQGKTNLNKEVEEYERLVSEFEAKLAAYNEEVKKWNDQGGAPEEEYNRLNQQQKDLEAEADRLNKMAETLNVSTQNYNSQVGKLNNTIGQFNEALSEKPEEGVYISGVHKIEIYFVPSKNEMIHTLAHELGHSLGIEHTTQDKKSIMYPYTSETITLSQEDKLALINVCRERAIWEEYQTKLKILLEHYKLQFAS